MNDNAVSTQGVLADRLEKWQALAERYAGQAYADAYVLCDVSERVVMRIDKPRVQNFPKLRYASPDPSQQNWTVMPGGSAHAAVAPLDSQAPLFAPHRAIHVRDLVSEQSAAIEHGLELLMGVEQPLLGEAASALAFGRSA